MLEPVIKIISILGILLLALLCVALVLFLLVLFFPITYRIRFHKRKELMQLTVKADWLFGILRLRYGYPAPGAVRIKLLFFTLPVKRKDNAPPAKTEETTADTDENKAPASAVEPASPSVSADAETKSTEAEISDAEGTNANASEPDNSEAPPQQGLRIKYTIGKICDKIKKLETLLTDEQTIGLFRHGIFRLGKMLKSIRPRRLKGNILFGAASPDTTGYVFAFYSMLSPYLGSVCVTPVFTEELLEGELYAKGHITLFRLLFHGIRLLLDRRLRLLVCRN